MNSKFNSASISASQ